MELKQPYYPHNFSKLLFAGLMLMVCSYTSAQIPNGFSYQTLIKDVSGNPVTEQAIGVQVSIRQGESTGTAVYTETFNPTTSGIGTIALEIGSGTSTEDFSVIDWKDGPYFLELSVDLDNGSNYVLYRVDKLQYVPFALLAGSALDDATEDSDADPLNETNGLLMLNGNVLELTDNAGTLSADLVTLVEDGADASSANELNTALSANGTNLVISDAGGDLIVDVAFIQDGTEDDDIDPQNELQTISKEGDQVSLSGVTGSVTDNSNTYQAGAGIQIDGNVISAGSSDCSFELGDTVNGAVIFYLDASGCHGLMLYPERYVAVWDHNPTVSVTGARARGIYSGSLNTYLITDQLGEGESAAYMVDTLTAAGFDDWYLPSYDEIDLVWQYYLTVDESILEGIFVYWTSTESNTGKAYIMRMVSGDFQQRSKGTLTSFFGIRRF